MSRSVWWLITLLTAFLLFSVLGSGAHAQCGVPPEQFSYGGGRNWDWGNVGRIPLGSFDLGELDFGLDIRRRPRSPWWNQQFAYGGSPYQYGGGGFQYGGGYGGGGYGGGGYFPINVSQNTYLLRRRGLFGACPLRPRGFQFNLGFGTYR